MGCGCNCGERRRFKKGGKVLWFGPPDGKGMPAGVGCPGQGCVGDFCAGIPITTINENVTRGG